MSEEGVFTEASFRILQNVLLPNVTAFFFIVPVPCLFCPALVAS